MIIQILEPYPAININYLTYLKEKWHNIIAYWNELNPDIVEWIVIRSNIVINSSFLEKYKNLRYIFRIWVWVDNIDLNLINKKNIILRNTPWANSQSVAEICLWWILSLLRNTNIKNNSYDNRFNYLWSELNNKIIWIIWFWNIWKILFKIINNFWNNQFLIYDPYINKDDYNFKNFTLCNNKDYIYRNADIITFHIPLTKETTDFLWEKDFSLLKSDVKIINTSRWWIINEDSLIDFLKHNKNAWVYMDTWKNEPYVRNPELGLLENCIITPHIWAMTEEANKKMHFFKI